jgi:amino acid transporter
MSTGEMEHTLLPKAIALPVFSSDPLSSNAYATQEAMLVLATAGVGALSLIIPISLAVAALLAIVVTSYRQTVRAYPTGGGAYRVSRENLGMYPGLISASALLIDYVLTVAVSMTAGVDALTSAITPLEPFEVELAIGFVLLVTTANLRGAKESGLLFAIPTYGFVAAIFTLLITGFVRCVGGCPVAESAGLDLEPHSAITFFLVLKAFAAGTTALTGVEAIADGVPAFRYPQSRNAATTLAIMGTLSISMFLGISWLANHTGVVFSEELESQRMVVAQVANAVFDGGVMFYVVQIMATAILVLAANTAYADFPRLSSILAGDRFLPRQFMNRGDRLVFSNGIVILAISASALIVIFEANLNRLIQLYLVGVFISFSFSQIGMVLRSRRLKPPGWRRTEVISGFGGTVTSIVLGIVIATKFTGGAWIVIVALPVLVFAMRSVHAHYSELSLQLARPERRPFDRRAGHQHMVVFVSEVDAGAARAVGYVRALRPAEVIAVTTDPANRAPWQRLAPEIPIRVLKGTGSRTKTLKVFLRAKRADLGDLDFLTVIVPEVLQNRSLFEVLRHPRLHRLKAALLRVRGIQVLDVPVAADDTAPKEDEAREPARNYAVVLVSSVNNAALQALEYAETLQPTEIRAVTIGLDPKNAERIGDAWLEERIPHALEIEDSPFRDIGRSLVDYVRQFHPDGHNRVVTVVIPEFVVSKQRHQLLHGQTALIVKRHLLFEDGVVVVSVPYHLDEEVGISRPAPH